MKLKALFNPVKAMGPDEARTFMAQHQEGAYTLLDVRQPGEYEKEHIPGAILIPLSELSEAAKTLDSSKPVLTY